MERFHELEELARFFFRLRDIESVTRMDKSIRPGGVNFPDSSYLVTFFFGKFKILGKSKTREITTHWQKNRRLAEQGSHLGSFYLGILPGAFAELIFLSRDRVLSWSLISDRRFPLSRINDYCAYLPAVRLVETARFAIKWSASRVLEKQRRRRTGLSSRYLVSGSFEITEQRESSEERRRQHKTEGRTVENLSVWRHSGKQRDHSSPINLEIYFEDLAVN